MNYPGPPNRSSGSVAARRWRSGPLSGRGLGEAGVGWGYRSNLKPEGREACALSTCCVHAQDSLFDPCRVSDCSAEIVLLVQRKGPAKARPGM